jgi:hypothetical protein
MGTQLALNHLIQFTGSQMSMADLGQVARNMPYLKGSDYFGDMTQAYDNWVNDRLAMDRGQMVDARKGEKHDYLINKIQGRMKERDFDLLSPQIKMNWLNKEQEHLQLQAEDLKAAQAAQAGFVPTGGFLATVDMYVPDPKDPTKTLRLKLPSETIQYVVELLKQQGTTQEMLQGFDQHTQGILGQMMRQGGNQPPGMANQPMPMAVGM